MNRRSFIADMLKAGVACTFLPGAGRIWKPYYVDAGDVRLAPMPTYVPDTLNLVEVFRTLYEYRQMRMTYDPDYHRYVSKPVSLAEFRALQAQS